MNSASVLIVNYNGAADLPLCLESLSRQTLPPTETLLVDNHSTDDSCQIASRFPGVSILSNSENIGFAGAANLGAALACGDVLVLLNTDLELVSTFLEEGMRAMQPPDVAAVASKILFFDRRNVINGIGGGMNYLGYGWDRGLNEIDHGQYDTSEEVFFASGGACFLRRELFLALGGFDPRFFMYHEDVDFCWRARLAGYRVVACPAAVVYHKYGATTRRELGWDRREILGERHNFRSLLKNYRLHNAIRALRDILLIPLPWKRKWAQLRNLMVNLAWLPDTLKLRRMVQATRRLSDADLKKFILQSHAVPVKASAPDSPAPAPARTA
ncbi:MAG TPA: glycosyltransferase family 2 protein [Acidobacteriota bacterium]|jgi:GT2 family glycosyltransferase|nr:glycosyltransferase family 2 protein [Acidobacteriota bacterium]